MKPDGEQTTFNPAAAADSDLMSCIAAYHAGDEDGASDRLLRAFLADRSLYEIAAKAIFGYLARSTGRLLNFKEAGAYYLERDPGVTNPQAILEAFNSTPEDTSQGVVSYADYQDVLYRAIYADFDANRAARSRAREELWMVDEMRDKAGGDEEDWYMSDEGDVSSPTERAEMWSDAIGAEE